MLNRKKFKIFPLKQGHDTSSLLFNIVFEVIVKTVRPSEGTKGNVNKKRSPSILFADDMTLSIKDPKVSARYLL